MRSTGMTSCKPIQNAPPEAQQATAEEVTFIRNGITKLMESSNGPGPHVVGSVEVMNKKITNLAQKFGVVNDSIYNFEEKHDVVQVKAKSVRKKRRFENVQNVLTVIKKLPRAHERSVKIINNTCEAGITIVATGYGKFSMFIIILAGLTMCTSLLGSVDVSFILPAAECDLKLSSKDKVSIGANNKHKINLFLFKNSNAHIELHCIVANVERDCCLDGCALSGPVLPSIPPALPLVVVRKSFLTVGPQVKCWRGLLIPKPVC
ncbi:hypothetical protein J6590_082666 [Homalodisca vitripennis]|nr:hypothetical protein J6590_082666 [Homalodisca vitripennis]